MTPCCPHPVDRHAYNGCAECGCNVRWEQHPDRDRDQSPSARAERWWLADRAMRSIGYHLSIAAALCHAFEHGFDAGWGASGEGFNGEYCPRLTDDRYRRMRRDGGSGYWVPGCGRKL